MAIDLVQSQTSLHAIELTVPNNKTLDLSKLKKFVDDKIHVKQKLKCVLGKAKKHWKKEKMQFTMIFSFSNNVIKRFLQPFPKQRILDSSKLNEFEDYNFKFDEKERKFF